MTPSEQGRPLSAGAMPDAAAVRADQGVDAPAETAVSNYLRILLRRKWILIAAMVLGVVGAMFVTFSTTPLYRATATLEIAREAARIVDQKGVEPPSTGASFEFYQTQYGLLRSRSLAERVVRDLRLFQNDTLLYGGETPPPPSEEGGAERREALIERATSIVAAGLVVTPVRGSGLVDVSFASTDPELSARVANAIAEAFVAQSLSRRFDATGYAREFLSDQLNQSRERLEEAERALVAYANQNRLISIDRPGGSGDGAVSQPLSSIDLEALNAALVQARADRIAAQARASAAGGSASVLNDNAISTLRGARSDLASQLARLRTTFGPDYPQVAALSDQIDELDREISRQQREVVGSVSADYRAAVQRENALQSQVDSLKQDVLDTRERSIQYNILQRQADTSRQQYQALLQRFNEVGVAGVVGANNVSIVDPAEVPGGPFAPQPLVNILVGLLLGGAAGLGLIFLVEQLDESVTVPSEIPDTLGIPLLGVIPKVVADENVNDTLDDRRSSVVEAYNSVATALRFSTTHGSPREIMVTSCRAAEGKSTTSLALSKVFARLGKRVLLIDADMRKPSLHKSLGLANAAGLSNLLTGSDDFQSVIHRDLAPNLSVITAGMLPPNPAELLADQRFRDTLTRLGGEYDQIIIDGPPVLGLADAPLIASYVEATLVVVGARETSRKAIVLAVKRLRDVHANVAGGVLTKFSQKQAGYYYGYGYGDNYTYGRDNRDEQ